MPLSWNEIRRRAVQFAQEFKDARRENAETHTFYNELFNVFGISRRRVASFEDGVMRLSPGQRSALLEGLDWTQGQMRRVRAPQATL